MDPNQLTQHLLHIGTKESQSLDQLKVDTDLVLGLSLYLLLAGPMTVIPLFLYVRGVELIGLGPTGMIFYITPTLQFILGYFYYGEDFSLVKFLSFIIIWIAVIIYLNDLYEQN